MPIYLYLNINTFKYNIYKYIFRDTSMDSDSSNSSNSSSDS